MTLSYQSYPSQRIHHDDDIILSYHNTCVRKSDLNLLLTSSADRWLNDIIISFAFEYFEYDLFQKYANSIAFLDPSVAHILKLSQESDLEFLLQPLNLKEKELIFIPINDHASSCDSGGTHWSLAVFYNAKFKNSKIHVYHYDSNHLSQGVSNNFNHALKLAQNLVPCLIHDNNTSSIQKNESLIPSIDSKKNALASFSPGQIAKNIKNGIIRSSPRLNKSFINFTASSNTINNCSSVKDNKLLLDYNTNFFIKEVSFCPQQINGYDCGVYCIAFAEIIALTYINFIKTMKMKNKSFFLNGTEELQQPYKSKPKNIIVTRNMAKNNPKALSICANAEHDEYNEDLSVYLDKEWLSSSSSNSSLSNSPNNKSHLFQFSNPTKNSQNNEDITEAKEEFILPYTLSDPINISQNHSNLLPNSKETNCEFSNYNSIPYLITPEYISTKRRQIYDNILALGSK